MREGYLGAPYTASYNVDAELVENSLLGSKKGRAAGIDHLTIQNTSYIVIQSYPAFSLNCLHCVFRTLLFLISLA